MVWKCEEENWEKKCMAIRIEGGGLLKYLLLSVYSPLSDRVGLPLHNILSPLLPLKDVFSVNL